MEVSCKGLRAHVGRVLALVACSGFLFVHEAAAGAGRASDRASSAESRLVKKKPLVKPVSKKHKKKKKKKVRVSLVSIPSSDGGEQSQNISESAPASESSIILEENEAVTDDCAHNGPSGAYRIRSPYDFFKAATTTLTQPNSYAVICNDLDFATAYTSYSASVKPIEGTLNGNGKVLRHRVLSDFASQYAGPLFGEIAPSGRVFNLTIADSHIDLYGFDRPFVLHGSLVADRNYGTLDSIRVLNSKVETRRVGFGNRLHAAGLVNENHGIISSVTIDSLHVSGAEMVGGVASRNHGIIRNVSVGIKSINTERGGWLGGVAGIVTPSGQIQSAYVSIAEMASLLERESPRDYEIRVGGVAGSSQGCITDSLADISSLTCSIGSCGGIVGHFGGTPESRIERVAAVGDFTCDNCTYLGGVAARTYAGNVADTSFRGQLNVRRSWPSGAIGGAIGFALNTSVVRGVAFSKLTMDSQPATSSIGGYMGEASNTSTFRLFFDKDKFGRTWTARGTALSAAQAVLQSTYQNFDFANVWVHPGIGSYPLLRVEAQ